MNWKEISEKCPKGFNKFLYWDGTFDDKEAVLKAMSLIYPERRLYDFFDKQEIFIEIEFYPIFECPKKPWTCNGIIFEGKDIRLKWCSEECLERGSAEVLTFTKAFEILEEKFNND